MLHSLSVHLNPLISNGIPFWQAVAILKSVSGKAGSINVPSGALFKVFSKKHVRNQDQHMSLPTLLCHVCYANHAA